MEPYRIKRTDWEPRKTGVGVGCVHVMGTRVRGSYYDFVGWSYRFQHGQEVFADSCPDWDFMADFEERRWREYDQMEADRIANGGCKVWVIAPAFEGYPNLAYRPEA